jgi:hypothetical protein
LKVFHAKVKGVKLSVLVNLQELPLSIIIVPTNQNDSTLYSKLYMHTLENFRIKRPKRRTVNRLSGVTADAMCDTVDIRKYNRRRIKSNITSKHKK